MNESERDARILLMEQLCIKEELDTPTPMLSCAVRYRDGPVFSHTIGGESDVALCAESIRHTMLAVLCAQLAACGKLTFSMPITRFLPQFPLKNVSIYEFLCDAVPMRLQIGLPYVCDAYALCEHITAGHRGTQIPYTCCNLLLGVLLEVASDIPLTELCKAYLFDPLGMRTTYFLSDVTSRIRLPYHTETDTKESHCEAEGKLFSTAQELLSFVCALADAANGKKVPVFTPKMANLLLMPHKETLSTPAFQMRGYQKAMIQFPDFTSPAAYLSMREPEAFLFTDTVYGVSYAVLSDNTVLSRDKSATARLGNVILHANA